MAEVQEWAGGLTEIQELIGPRFGRTERARERGGIAEGAALGQGAEEFLYALRAGRADDPGPDAVLVADAPHRSADQAHHAGLDVAEGQVDATASGSL